MNFNYFIFIWILKVVVLLFVLVNNLFWVNERVEWRIKWDFNLVFIEFLLILVDSRDCDLD